MKQLFESVHIISLALRPPCCKLTATWFSQQSASIGGLWKVRAVVVYEAWQTGGASRSQGVGEPMQKDAEAVYRCRIPHPSLDYDSCLCCSSGCFCRLSTRPSCCALCVPIAAELS